MSVLFGMKSKVKYLRALFLNVNNIQKMLKKGFGCEFVDYGIFTC